MTPRLRTAATATATAALALCTAHLALTGHWLPATALAYGTALTAWTTLRHARACDRAPAIAPAREPEPAPAPPADPAPAPFIATRVHAAVTPGAPCACGTASVRLTLHGRNQHTPPTAAHRIVIAIPRCALATAVGTILGTIHTDEGPAAAADMADEISATARETAATLHQAAAHRPCCQAGHLTGGREHTCRPHD
ncbi:hypothetical protein [Streptomyces uncialis]|uniref:hypothetical protein n=1 Tax=Streptomyces uncialis TaxID=1048205 RepID=UPI002253ADF8|nr:hypothetical protein [Streptomyces uncialis]MCX4661484.1 hypothetical protein [Streptomyces uncialis]